MGSPTPTGSRIPPFLVQLGVLPCIRSRRQGRGREKGRKERVRHIIASRAYFQHLPLVQFGLGLGAARPALGSPSLSPLKPIRAHILPGGFR